MKRFEIKTEIDRMVAERMLADHRQQLSEIPANETRAIAYTVGCILELESVLSA